MARNAPTIALADYLLTRLRQLGVDSIHGVPGDYNLELLDHVEDQGFNWVGNCNELNAGYAADGYARIKRAAALITTFGVGELSAINAIAGSYAELAPVIHIVGTPARHSRSSRALIHHTLNDGDYTYFSRMAEPVTVAQAVLEDPRTCPAQIDTALQQCLIHSRPVYITIPADMVKTPVDASPLETDIIVPVAPSAPSLSRAVSYLQDRIQQSRQPLILVDGESRAYGIIEALDDLVKRTGWPTWTSTFGKGLVNEELNNAMGLWKSRLSPQAHQQYFEKADLILCFGPHFSGTNTYGYSAIPNSEVTIFFEARVVKANGQVFNDLPARTILEALLQSLQDVVCRSKSLIMPAKIATAHLPAEEQLQQPVTQASFYSALNRVLRPGDIVFGETGTAGYGCRDLQLKTGCRITLPVTWLSIGYMLPAAQGAALAQEELHSQSRWTAGPYAPRTILVIGDGSLQMTVQEISTMIKHKLNILIIVINNDGYTIEKYIHGRNRAYNGVASWQYLAAPTFFGASIDKNDEYYSKTAQARTLQEVSDFLADSEDDHKPRLRMLEVFVDQHDAPADLMALLNKPKE